MLLRGVLEVEGPLGGVVSPASAQFAEQGPLLAQMLTDTTSNVGGGKMRKSPP